MSGGITAKEIETIHHLIAEIQGSEGCMVQWLWMWMKLHIVKVSSRRRMENCTRQRLCMEELWLFTSQWSVGLVNKDKTILENSRLFSSFFTKRQSHFETSERVKIFVEISLRRRRSELGRERRIVQRTRRGIHFTVVADKLDLSSTQRRLEKYNFDCAVNNLLYVAPTLRDKCAPSHLIFDLATFLCFTCVSEA